MSTHGVVDRNGSYYLAPVDITGADRSLAPDRLTSWIRADALRDWLRRLPLRELALWIDACESTSALAADGFKPGPFDSSSLGQLAYDKKKCESWPRRRTKLWRTRTSKMVRSRTSVVQATVSESSWEIWRRATGTIGDWRS